MVTRRAVVPDQRVPLSKGRVLQTAIRLADKGGIESLTMRRLAQELGVEAMSLYYYVASKDDILNGIVEMVLGKVEPPTGGADWKSGIRRSAISFHDALSRHPWAAVLMRKTALSVAQLRYMDALLGRLRGAGFSADTTYHAYHALDSHILGSTLWEAGFANLKGNLADLARHFLQGLPVDQYPHFAEHVQQHVTRSVRGKSTFEFGLDLILDSLERMLGGPARRRRKRGVG